MTENKTNPATGGSERIPQRRSAGIAGSSREVSQCDHEPSGAGCAGRENEELRWARRHVPAETKTLSLEMETPKETTGTGRTTGQEPVPEKQNPRPAPRLTERATVLRGRHIGRPPEPKRVQRRRTLLAIWDKDGEIPYIRYETASRDLICSLMERQDRMNEAIFERLIDIECRIDDLDLNCAECSKKIPVAESGKTGVPP